MLSPLDLIPAPYGLIAKIALPIALVGGVWIAGDIHGHHAQSKADAAQHAADQGTIANFKSASTTAKAKNATHVQTVETAQDAVTKGHENDYPTQLAALRAAYAAYVKLHPGAPAYPSYPSKDGLSEIPLTTGKPDDAAPSATVPLSDLDACAQSYVIATGLQSWIRDQSAINRSDQ